MKLNSTVMATLAGVRSDKQTQEFLKENLNHWKRYGYGLWIFRDKVKNQFVGRGGLRNVHIADNDEVELAYSLMTEFWGKGLATEMGETILKVGFEQLGLTEVVCFTTTTNRASQRVMEKLGFQYERNLIHADLHHVFYRLKALPKYSI
ncbi:MAG: GNAT family N-acetyltransferase [Nostoc sp.]|uniref:GNAT family N-acetyltransferase n=1 Tax=Nostoc sp. TaxID=1180 RepID=UPI002FFC0C35